MTVLHPLPNRERNLGTDITARQIIDVTVLGHDKTIAPGLPPVDRPMQLQDHRALSQRQPRVLLRQLDRNHIPRGRAMHKPTPQTTRLRLIPNNVIGLAGLVKRPLDKIIVIRRQHQQLRPTPIPQNRRQPREQAMQRTRGIVNIKHLAQIPVQITLAKNRIDILRDPQQIRVTPIRKPALLSQTSRQLQTTRRKHPQLPPHPVRPITQIRARTQKRNHLTIRQQTRDQRKMTITTGAQHARASPPQATAPEPGPPPTPS